MNKMLVTFSAAALLAVGFSGAGATGVTRVVKFAPGQTWAWYGGSIRGYDYDRYVFQARAGQRLNVKLPSQYLDAVIGGKALPDMLDLNNQTLVLPRNGTYEVRVLQSRAAARRGEVHPYKVTIQIR